MTHSEKNPNIILFDICCQKNINPLKNSETFKKGDLLDHNIYLWNLILFHDLFFLLYLKKQPHCNKKFILKILCFG